MWVYLLSSPIIETFYGGSNIHRYSLNHRIFNYEHDPAGNFQSNMLRRSADLPLGDHKHLAAHPTPTSQNQNLIHCLFKPSRSPLDRSRTLIHQITRGPKSQLLIPLPIPGDLNGSLYLSRTTYPQVSHWPSEVCPTLISHLNVRVAKTRTTEKDLYVGLRVRQVAARVLSCASPSCL